MGNVAKSYINKLIQNIKEKEKSKEELIALIEPIGEPLIKDQLKNLLDENYPSFEGNIKNIDQYIQSLENTLLEAKKIKADLNENSNKS